MVCIPPLRSIPYARQKRSKICHLVISTPASPKLKLGRATEQRAGRRDDYTLHHTFSHLKDIGLRNTIPIQRCRGLSGLKGPSSCPSSKGNHPSVKCTTPATVTRSEAVPRRQAPSHQRSQSSHVLFGEEDMVIEMKMEWYGVCSDAPNSKKILDPRSSSPQTC
eukprot:356334-Pleurochrysis_carterae.AAC.2